MDEFGFDTSEDLAMKQEAFLIGGFSLGDSNNDGEGVEVVAIAAIPLVVVSSPSSSSLSPEEYSS